MFPRSLHAGVRSGSTRLFRIDSAFYSAITRWIASAISRSQPTFSRAASRVSCPGGPLTLQDSRQLASPGIHSWHPPAGLGPAASIVGQGHERSAAGRVELAINLNARQGLTVPITLPKR
jgi:hypothetical protein